MEFPSAQANLQLRFYLFHDDLKEALYGEPDHVELDPEKAATYIANHFSLRIDGKPMPLHFDTMKWKNDQVQLQFTCPHAHFNGSKRIEVRNTILIETFPRQVNMVYLLPPDGRRITLMLHARKTEGNFDL
jgi:hypothetical protein